MTIDIAREIAARLGVGVEFACFDAARDSLAALTDGTGRHLLPRRSSPPGPDEVAFTAPYVLIEGVYAVPDRSPLATVADVDSPGVRIGVKRGSAYDLFLSRTLRHAAVVRGAEGTDGVPRREPGGGGRGPRAGDRVRRLAPGIRLIEGRFMEIRQAVGTTKAKRPETIGSCTSWSRS